MVYVVAVSRLTIQNPLLFSVELHILWNVVVAFFCKKMFADSFTSEYADTGLSADENNGFCKFHSVEKVPLTDDVDGPFSAQCCSAAGENLPVVKQEPDDVGLYDVTYI